MSSLSLFLSLLISLVLHEWAHAWSASLFGDPTPAVQKRLSMNPWRHLDPVGTLFLAFIAWGGWGVGWAKPVQISPSCLKHPRRALFFISLAGPLMNLLLAISSCTVFAFLEKSSLFSHLGRTGEHILFDFFLSFLLVNVSLFFFNLLPLFPLDGSKVLLSLLPEKLSCSVETQLVRWGLFPLFLLLLAEWVTPLKPLTLLILPGIQGVVEGMRALAQL